MSQSSGGPDPSFEDRLTAARRKQGLDVPPKPHLDEQGSLSGSPMAIGLRVGVELVSALVVAVAIGYGLDRLFGTTPILTAVFVPIGGAAGVMNIWRLLGPKRTD
jgi:ATP synthase protein I